jgi:hypothetical protein
MVKDILDAIPLLADCLVDAERLERLALLGATGLMTR